MIVSIRLSTREAKCRTKGPPRAVSCDEGRVGTCPALGGEDNEDESGDEGIVDKIGTISGKSLQNLDSIRWKWR